MRAGGTVKQGVSSKAARPANEALVKKGSPARSWPTPFSGLNVLGALDAWTVLLPDTAGGLPRLGGGQSPVPEAVPLLGRGARPILP